MSGTYRSKYEALVGALPERDQRILACRIARWALTEFEVEYPRLWEAVTVAERYADGLATPQELRAAADAAWDAVGAARAAAEDAAADAAWAARAAVGAARTTDQDAAWAARAAGAAAAGAAWEAAEDADGAAWAAEDATYKRFFEWALELAIGEKVAE